MITANVPCFEILLLAHFISCCSVSVSKLLAFALAVPLSRLPVGKNGGLLTIRSNFLLATNERASMFMNSVFCLNGLEFAFLRAISIASSFMSMPVIAACGNLCASIKAITPLPVPMSRMVVA